MTNEELLGLKPGDKVWSYFVDDESGPAIYLTEAKVSRLILREPPYANLICLRYANDAIGDIYGTADRFYLARKEALDAARARLLEEVTRKVEDEYNRLLEEIKT